MPDTAVGPAQAAFVRLIARYAAGLRAGSAAVAAAAAFLGLAAPATLPRVTLAAGALAVWSATYAVVALTRGLTRWLVVGDMTLAAALCLGQAWLVPAASLASWSSWVYVAASATMIANQLSPWPRLGVAATVLVTAAHAAGPYLAGTHGRIAVSALLATQGIVGGALMRTMRRSGRAVDAVIARHEAARREDEVRAARRAEELEHYRLLHDSVSATLTVVAAGGLVSSATLRAQAGRDLRVIERIQDPASEVPSTGDAGPGARDLAQWLRPITDRMRPALPVELAITDLAVPAVVGSALAAAVAEALTNVTRHAGGSRAWLRALPADGGVLVELSDDGPGFDPAQVAAHRRGLRESVIARMAAVGGVATIASAPGRGTRVRLLWPATCADPDQQPAGTAPNADTGTVPGGRAPKTTRNGETGADASEQPAGTARNGATGSGSGGQRDLGAGEVSDEAAIRYRHHFTMTIIGLVTVRHVTDLAVLASFAATYRPLSIELAAWMLMAGAGVTAAVRLRRSRTGRAGSWLLAGAILVANAMATVAVPARAELAGAHWAIGAAGWLGLLALVRRPVAELAVLIGVDYSFALAMLVHDGVADRVSLARFLAIASGQALVQLSLVLAPAALNTTTRRAADAAQAEAATRWRGQLADMLHAGRQDRYQTVRRSVAPLLAELASGQLDPASPRTQRRCAIEASRLRRLFAETDDAPDPLLHELRACTDIADRRGVLVDLLLVGRVPQLDRAVRRALAEAPLQALAGARRQARVTVLGRPDLVAVSVLADGRGPVLTEMPIASDPTVTISVQQEPDQQWVEARWRHRADREPVNGR